MKDDLEKFIDKTSISLVAEVLAEICEEKAEHVQTTWQDNTLACEWRQAREIFERVAGLVAEL